jgi:transglutaminase/protease-like cytokinesis protein 3
MNDHEIKKKIKNLSLEIERENRHNDILKKRSNNWNNLKGSTKKLTKRIFLALKIWIFISISLCVLFLVWAQENPLYKEVMNKNSEQRIQIVTRYIVENMIYNYIPGTKYNIGADSLERGGAVCDGYTRAFQRLAFLNGIPSKAICGVAGTRSGYGYHAWNKVKLNGKWYWHDVTWIDNDNA